MTRPASPRRRRPAPALTLALALALALVAGGCGASSPTEAPSGGPATVTSASPSGAGPDGSPATTPSPPATPSPSPVDPALAPFTVGTDIVEAATGELALRDRLREAAGVAAVLGPQATTILAVDDELVAAARTEALAQAWAKAGPKAGTGGGGRASDPLRGLLAAAGGAAGPRPSAVDEVGSADWFGGLGFASIAVSMEILMFTSGAFGKAAEPTYSEGTIDHVSTSDRTANGLTVHTVTTDRLTMGGGGGRVLLDTVSTVNATTTDTASGRLVSRRTSRTTAHYELNGCPTADGLAEGTYRIGMEEQVAGTNGDATAWHATASGPIRVTDDDAARLVSSEVEAQVEVGADGFDAGGPWQTSGTYAVGVGPNLAAMPQAGSAVAVSGSPPDLAGAARASLLAIIAWHVSEVGKHAETLWRSGACIDLRPSETSRDVQPSETVTIDVDPVGAFDKQPVKAPVTAAFNGTKSLDPVDTPKDPPATFTFTAGDREGDKGTVDLTQTGRRGIGKAQLVFTVAGVGYVGTWSGTYLAGIIIRCASSTPGFWAGDVVTKAGDRPAISWQFGPDGGTVATHLDVPSAAKVFNRMMLGTGTLQLDGANPTFILVNGEGRYVIRLKKEKYRFCK